MNTSIIIKNLEFEAYHGVYAEEKEFLRKFQVDIMLSIDLGLAAKHDDLHNTVDYAELCQIVVETGTEKTYSLIETLGNVILTKLTARCPNATIELELRKLHPRCPGNPAYSAVRITHAPSVHCP